ncbi:ABC transporter substrate-binding protein [Paracoccus pacificus]|uniref:ABC transporter substrate-binding protein n=1 Tax=Paracoccus pacificus TaxID=1463598 RepID=A0ABW4R2W3_9RHOB
MNLTRRTALGVLAATSALTALPLAARAQNTAINVGVLRLTSHAPTFIAAARGYFKDEGLDVTLSFFESAAALSVGVAGGDVAYGMTAITGSLFNLAQKGAVKVIAGALSEDPNVPGAMILASNAAFDAGLTEPAKLGGHTFGITTAGSSFDYMLSQILAAENIPMTEVTLKPLQKLPAVVGALSSGQIDAWVIQPSVGLKLLADNAAKKIGDYNKYDPDYQVTAVFTSTDVATNKRDQTEAYLRALAKGADDYNAAFIDKTATPEQVAELVEIVRVQVSPDVPLDKFTPSMTEGSQRISKGLNLSVKSLERQLKFLQDNGLVDKAITVDMLVDPSYVTTT